MELKNPLYKNIGAHVIDAIFTIDKGIIKVLLVKRTNEPYKGMWALVGGAMYNNETIEEAAKRELKEKTNIEGIELIKSEIFDKVDRSPMLRMFGFSLIGLVDIEQVNLLKETSKTSDADWFPVDKIPPLAYDHEEILISTIEKLKQLILSTDILKILYPNGFVLPELHQVYESILNARIDRRNFRKKLISSGMIKDTNKTVSYKGRKPAKIYIFNEDIKDKPLF